MAHRPRLQRTRSERNAARASPYKLNAAEQFASKRIAKLCIERDQARALVKQLRKERREPQLSKRNDAVVPERRILALEQELIDIRKRNFRRAVRIEELEGILCQRNKALHSERNDIHKLQDDYEAACKHVTMLEGQLALSEDNLADAKEETLERVQEAEQLKKQLEAVQNELADAQHTIEGLDSIVATSTPNYVVDSLIAIKGQQRVEAFRRQQQFARLVLKDFFNTLNADVLYDDDMQGRTHVLVRQRMMELGATWPLDLTLCENWDRWECDFWDTTRYRSPDQLPLWADDRSANAPPPTLIECSYCPTSPPCSPTQSSSEEDDVIDLPIQIIHTIDLTGDDDDDFIPTVTKR